MARPVRSGKAPSTTLLFHVTIQRPGRLFGTPLRTRSGLRAKKGRRYGKSVRFRSSRRALPPFFLFMEKHRQQLQRSYPNWTVVQTSKRLGRMWHRLPEAEKDVYKEQAERMKGRRPRQSRSRGPKMSSRRGVMKNLMISFTTKVASLRNFLTSYL